MAARPWLSREDADAERFRHGAAIERPRIYLALAEARIALCLTPKVASSSIIAAILRFYEIDANHVLHLHPALPFMDRTAVSEHLGRWRRALFVRNPFDRLVSCYLFHIRETGLAKSANMKRVGYHRRMTFSDFIEQATTNPGADPHTALQSRQFGHVDFVGKVESLDADWQRFREFSGLALPDLPRLNATNVSGRNYREFYDERLRALVERTYAESLTTFGYSF